MHIFSNIVFYTLINKKATVKCVHVNLEFLPINVNKWSVRLN